MQLNNNVLSQLTDTYDIYWSVNGAITYSKHQAWIWAKGNMDQIHFHCMENTWKNVNFTVEPTMSWDELCKWRAQELRDKYNHVCLMFSGGYDSLHILTVFRNNKIPIDELLIMDRRTYLNDGENDMAIQLANQYKQTENPNCKITVADVGINYHLNWWRNNNHALTEGRGTNPRFTRTIVSQWWSEHPDCQHLWHPNAVTITGLEGPRLDIRDNFWYTWMGDVPMGVVAGSDLTMFYCSDSMPELYVKQVHMLMRWFESENLATHKMVHAVQGHAKIPNHLEIFKKYKLSMGRVLPPSPSAVIKSQRFTVTESVNSLDGKTMLDYVQYHDPKVYKRFVDGVYNLAAVNLQWDPFKDKWPIKFGKQYPVRPVSNLAINHYRSSL